MPVVRIKFVKQIVFERCRSHNCVGDAMRIEPYGKQQDLSPQASRSGLCEISKHEKVLVAHGHKKKRFVLLLQCLICF